MRNETLVNNWNQDQMQAQNPDYVTFYWKLGWLGFVVLKKPQNTTNILHQAVFTKLTVAVQL